MNILRSKSPSSAALVVSVSLGLAGAVGCGADDATTGSAPLGVGQNDSGVLAGDGGLVFADGSTLPNQGTGAPDASTGGFDTCAGKVAEAARQAKPVNVVWVVDSSGSMGEESKAVQDNMNAFAEQIGKAGIADYRVVLITGKDAFDLVVPPPLGNDATHFLYVDRDVGSKAPLQVLNAQFGQYGQFLLKDAITHFVVVTDDESSVTTETFLNQMRTNLGANATFKVHAIASERVTPTRQECIPVINICSTADWCDGAAAVGERHYAAAAATNGLTFSICTKDWTSLFGKLGEAVSAPIPCELGMPEPEPGATVDPLKVNVLFKGVDQAAASQLPAVKDAAGCGTQSAWYYDDVAAPKRIILCPNACTTVEKGGTLELKLGCATELR